MPHARRHGGNRALLALVCALWSLSCERAPVGVTTVASALYARTDSNATTVWAPRLRVAGAIGDGAGVETAIAMDAWTGASIDVVTAATKAVHEVRQEITAGGFYTFDDLTVSGGYRYSTENDYWSHGAVGTLTLDLASNNTTLALAGFGSRDVVGRAGDPGFRELQRTLGARLSLTQILDKQTLVQASWETTRVNGYQAGPYRFVGIGGDGTCAGSAPLCVPEAVPDLRYRHAISARGRRAFGDHLSVGLEYRFYFDSWGLSSQTLLPELTWLLSERTALALSYRYYTQREVDFYRVRYLAESAQLGFVTRDRELSALYSNRIGLSVQHKLELGSGGQTLTAALRTAVTRYRYLAFVGLSQVDALEGTLLLSFDWN